MERMEMVEKLREKADITLEEAKETLERNNWDMLDAMIDMERQGKIHSGAKAETGAGANPADSCETVNPTVMGNAYHEDKKEQEKQDRPWNRLKEAVKSLVRMGIDNQFVITKDGSQVAKVPVIVPIVMAIAAFWLTIGALFVGLLFNFRYSLEGKELGKDSINHTMDKASDFAQNLVNSVKDDSANASESEDNSNTEK